MHGDIFKHLGINLSTDQIPIFDRYSNLFLNAYIYSHAHTEYLKMIEVYSPCCIWHVFLYSIYTNIYLGTTSFRPPKKYFVLFYLLSSPIVLVIALYYQSVQGQQI